MAENISRRSMAALHFATKIGSEVVYLDKQVFNASMKNHRSTKSGRPKPVAGRSMEQWASVWWQHKVSQLLQFVHHAVGPFALTLFSAGLKHSSLYGEPVFNIV